MMKNTKEANENTWSIIVTSDYNLNLDLNANSKPMTIYLFELSRFSIAIRKISMSMKFCEMLENSTFPYYIGTSDKKFPTDGYSIDAIIEPDGSISIIVVFMYYVFKGVIHKGKLLMNRLSNEMKQVYIDETHNETILLSQVELHQELDMILKSTSEHDFKYFHQSIFEKEENKLYLIGSYSGDSMEDYSSDQCHVVDLNKIEEGFKRISWCGIGRNSFALCDSGNRLIMIGGNVEYNVLTELPYLVEVYSKSTGEWEFYNEQCEYLGSSYSKAIALSETSVLLLSGMTSWMSETHGDCWEIKFDHEKKKADFVKISRIANYIPMQFKTSYYGKYVSVPIIVGNRLYFVSFNENIHSLSLLTNEWVTLI